MERRRNGSVASSKKSGTSPGLTQANPSKAITTTAQSPPMQKPKKSGGLLGFLNCCGASDSANGAEDDAPVPVKKVPKVESQAPLRMTSSKPESIQLQPVPSRPAGPLLEKNIPRPLETVQNPAVDQDEDSRTPSKSKQEDVQGSLDRKASSKDIRDQPLPALPQDADKISRNENNSSNPSVIVQAPTPIRPKQEETVPPPLPATEEVNASRDAEMTDTPPVSTGETKTVSVNSRDAQPMP